MTTIKLPSEGVKLTRNRLHRACCDPLNAINWALDSGGASGAERAFLADWRCGDFGEWGDYVEWVRRVSVASPSALRQAASLAREENL